MAKEIKNIDDAHAVLADIIKLSNDLDVELDIYDLGTGDIIVGVVADEYSPEGPEYSKNETRVTNELLAVMKTIDGAKPLSDPHGTHAISIPMIKSSGVEEGYSIIKDIDRDRYGDRSHEGLEGPFTLRNGKVVYYDTKAGMHYDSDTDMYIEYDDYVKMDTPTNITNEAATADVDQDLKNVLLKVLKKKNLRNFNDEELSRLANFLMKNEMVEFEFGDDPESHAQKITRLVVSKGDMNKALVAVKNGLSEDTVKPVEQEDEVCEGETSAKFMYNDANLINDIDSTLGEDPSLEDAVQFAKNHDFSSYEVEEVNMNSGKTKLVKSNVNGIDIFYNHDWNVYEFGPSAGTKHAGITPKSDKKKQTWDDVLKPENKPDWLDHLDMGSPVKEDSEQKDTTLVSKLLNEVPFKALMDYYYGVTAEKAYILPVDVRIARDKGINGNDTVRNIIIDDIMGRMREEAPNKYDHLINTMKSKYGNDSQKSGQQDMFDESESQEENKMDMHDLKAMASTLQEQYSGNVYDFFVAASDIKNDEQLKKLASSKQWDSIEKFKTEFVNGVKVASIPGVDIYYDGDSEYYFFVPNLTRVEDVQLDAETDCVDECECQDSDEPSMGQMSGMIEDESVDEEEPRMDFSSVTAMQVADAIDMIPTLDHKYLRPEVRVAKHSALNGDESGKEVLVKFVEEELKYTQPNAYGKVIKTLGVQVEESNVVGKDDLGYGETHVPPANYGEFFPNGATGPVTNKVGPAGARHGDSPLQKAMKVTESKSFASMKEEYEKFLKDK